MRDARVGSTRLKGMNNYKTLLVIDFISLI
jgi:hypothetical protein